MTKAGRYASKDGGPSKSDFSEGTIRASIDDSLDRLGVEYVDVMNLHDVEFAGSLDQVINEALPALVEAKAAGKVRHIGITGLPLGVLDYCVERSGEAGIDVECILSYCCYTLNCTTLELNLPRWKHRGIGVVQGGATSMGLLTPGGPQDWHPAPAVVKEVCKRAVDVCQSQLGENIIKLAFQFASSAPEVATCLIGPVSREQLLTNLAWMNEVPDPDVLREVQAVLAPIRNRLWVESGSEENIALASGGFWAEGHGSVNKITGISANLQS